MRLCTSRYQLSLATFIGENMAVDNLIVTAILTALMYAVLDRRQNTFTKFVYTYALLISLVGWVSWPETRFVGNEYLRFAVCAIFYIDFNRVPNPPAFATLAILAILTLASGYIQKEKLVFAALAPLAIAQFYGALQPVGLSASAYLVFLGVFLPVKLPVRFFVAALSIPLFFVDIALAPDSNAIDSISAFSENIGLNRFFLAGAATCSILSVVIPKGSERFHMANSDSSFGLLAAAATMFIFSSVPAADVNFASLFFAPTRWIVACLILISYLVWRFRSARIHEKPTANDLARRKKGP